MSVSAFRGSHLYGPDEVSGATPALPYKILHGPLGMGQMMFTKYIIVVDDDVNVHNTSEISSGSKLGIDATLKLSGEGFKRPGLPLIKMDAAAKAKVEKLFATDNLNPQA